MPDSILNYRDPQLPGCVSEFNEGSGILPSVDVAFDDDWAAADVANEIDIFVFVNQNYHTGWVVRLLMKRSLLKYLMVSLFINSVRIDRVNHFNGDVVGRVVLVPE